MNNPESKECSRCNKIKSIEEFSKRKLGKHGRTVWCKECMKEYIREWSKNNPDYYKNNAEKIRKRKKEYYKNNREKMDERSKEYYKNNIEKIRNYYKNNSEKIKEKVLEYQKNNPEKVKEFWKRRDEKRRSNSVYHLSYIISRLIGKSLKRKKNGHHWETLVNFTLEELIIHLEKQFKPGMNWNNHSFYGWHIDHIRPISSFNFNSYNDPEFKECWALSNLQPLWWIDNIKKGNRT